MTALNILERERHDNIDYTRERDMTTLNILERNMTTCIVYTRESET